MPKAPKHVQVLLDADLYDKLDKRARRDTTEGRASIAALLRRIIKEYFEKPVSLP